MASTFLFAPFVVSPAYLREGYVTLLAPLCSAGQEHNDLPAILSEVNAVTWTKIDAPFIDASAYGFHIAPVASFHPGYGRANLHSGHGIQLVKPAGKWRISILRLVKNDFDHRQW